MGDLASRDAEGRLWFAGRKAHVVHTAAGPLYSVPCEEVFNRAPGRAPLRARRRRARRARPSRCSCVQLEHGAAPRAGAHRRAARARRRRPAHRRRSPRVLYQDDFPVDIRHNSKIDRPELGAWAAGQP